MAASSDHSKGSHPPPTRRAKHLANSRIYVTVLGVEEETRALIDVHPTLFFFSSSLPELCGGRVPNEYHIGRFCDEVKCLRDNPEIGGRRMVFYDYEEEGTLAASSLLLGAYLVKDEGVTPEKAAGLLGWMAERGGLSQDKLLRYLETAAGWGKATDGSAWSFAGLFPIREEGQIEVCGA
eukprot:CAMPEP_0174930388 /NCGR_PEP_ID=MMETSP1355-20121228/31131_1 /TAXON_ID=464990 /ORGANISM="Hemiselmis tepida, Strain CCMP443" /LENGTH=179 /DNA_ID=CAMNT_0016176679 /DNA_START=60 /DNA_END=602 /DNA_ORIENTATION=+